jgi:hypothetical protein
MYLLTAALQSTDDTAQLQKTSPLLEKPDVAATCVFEFVAQ